MNAKELRRTVGDLAKRAIRRARYELGALIDERIRDVVFVEPDNAASVAATYDSVGFDTLIETDAPSRVVPGHLPEDSLPGIEPFTTELRSVLFDIDQPGFSLRNRMVLDHQPRVLFPASATKEQVLFFNEHAPRPRRHVPGTVAYLSNTWVDNYYHWLQLTVPLIRLYRKLAPNVSIDYYYVGRSGLTNVVRETLARFDIAPDQILFDSCTANRILALFCMRPSAPGGFPYRESYGHDFVQSAFLPVVAVPDDSLPRRVYVQRGNTRMRRLLNEPSVVSFLKSQGFVTVRMDGLSIADQGRMFWNAEAIVGLHGAALTNLLFARPGTTVIEIFPFEVNEASMFTAASHSRLNYYYVRGAPLNSPEHRRHVGKQHTVLDVQKLAAVMRMAGLYSGRGANAGYGDAAMPTWGGDRLI